MAKNTIVNKNNTYEHCTVYNTQQSSSSQQEEVPSQLFGFPCLSKNITGRDTDVGLLLELFQEHQQVLITGIAGLGKTTLGILCATTWVSNKKFKYAALINVETDDSATNGFRDFAEEIFGKTIKNVTKIYEHCNTLQVKTIFVLDNIVIKCNIHKYLPDETLKNVFVLGTSQFIEFERVFKLYKLRTLSLDSSVDIIRNVLLYNKKPININENITQLISDIARKLDYHPLALEHAAAYIVDCILYNEMSVLASVEHYIKTYNKLLEKEPPPDHPTTYRKSVYTALKMNIEKATSESEDACKLLFCLSCLDPTDIDIRMFYEHPDFNSGRIKAPIRELKRYSIISLNYSYIRLHRLIPIVYRDLIKKENTENNYIVVLLNVLFYLKDKNLDRHFNYLIQNLNINKETMSTLYTRAFCSNDMIVNRLTSKLRLIHCDMDDIKDWSALHCSVIAGHETFFKYFNTSEHSSRDDRLKRFPPYFTVHNDVRSISDYHLNLFYRWAEINLIPFFKLNENRKNKKIVKGLITLHLCAAFNISTYYFSKLIDISCDLNISDDSGMTPILWAVKNAAYKLVFILHKAGATYDQSYKELLSAASSNNHESVLALLRISDIDCAASDFSKTLLYWAIRMGYCDLALELIKRHTDINGTDSRGDTPLLVAARQGHSVIVAELLRRSALVNNNGNKLLLVAAEGGHSEVALELLRSDANINCDVNVTDDSGMTPILYAAKKMAYKLVFILHRTGATYNQSYKELLSAASNGDHKSVLALLRTRDIDCAASDFSKTLLYWAINEGHCDLALELIKRHTDVNGADNDGNTPLLVAAKLGHSEIALELLHRDANIEIINYYGETPLLVAAKKGHSRVALELLRHDINIETINNDGDTPLLMAARWGHSEVALELLRRNANIETTNNRGDTPLLVATMRGHREVALELLRRNANIETTNNRGDTPLLVATMRGHREVALELLRRNANIETTNNRGDTPLLVAAMRGHSEVALELLRRGENINAKNKWGETALSIAKRYGHSNLVKLLNEHGAGTGGEPS